MSKTATLTVQQWGNSLAVRIPANVLVRAIGEPKLSLAQKLAAFDPDRHAGEVMATTQVGREVF